MCFQFFLLLNVICFDSKYIESSLSSSPPPPPTSSAHNNSTTNKNTSLNTVEDLFSSATSTLTTTPTSATATSALLNDKQLNVESSIASVNKANDVFSSASTNSKCLFVFFVNILLFFISSGG